MNNPFGVIALRLDAIENLILDLKHSQLKAQPTTKEKDVLLTVKQTAKLLHMTVPTIYTKVSRKELPYMKRGKRLYFSRTELLAYLKEGSVKPNENKNA